MKKLAGIVVILAALILGSYYVMGCLTQRKITESLKGINLTNDLSVSMVDYQRGWFTSKVAFTWQLTLPKYTTTVDGQTKDIPAANYQLPMPVTVYHGPVIFSDKGVKFGLGYAHTKLALPANAVEAFNDLFTAASMQPTLALSFFVNYFGNSNVDVSLPPFKLLPKDGSGEFNWSGLQAATHFFPRMNKVDGHVKLNGVQFTEDRLKVVSSSVISNYDLHETPMGYYLGTANLSFPSIQISQDTNKLLELKQFQVESNSDIVDNLFNTDFSVTTDQIYVASFGNYGPAHLKVDIRNIDAQALANIDEEIKKTQQISTPNQDSSLLSIMNQLPGVFGKGAEIEIKEFDFVTPEGKINANFLLTLPKYDAPNMFNLLQKLKAHGKLVLPTDVVKKLLLIQENLISSQSNGQPGANPTQPGQEKLLSNPQQPQTLTNTPNGTQPVIIPVEQRLSAMLKSGFMKSDGRYYTIEVQFEQGNLLINGQPFNANMLNF